MEAYALLHGVKSVNPSKVKSIIPMGNSSIIIHFLNYDKVMDGDKLVRVITRIKEREPSICGYLVSPCPKGSQQRS